MQRRITNCPKRVNVFPTSRTVSPVTQVAEVAVNNASIKVKLLLAEIGRRRRIVPENITIRKLNGSILLGERGFCFIMKEFLSFDQKCEYLPVSYLNFYTFKGR